VAGHRYALPSQGATFRPRGVCFYLTSGFAWPVRPRDAGPGADHRTGRVELPIYIIQVYYYYTCGTIVYPYRWCLEEHGSRMCLAHLAESYDILI
jgi:hypothetical protein